MRQDQRQSSQICAPNTLRQPLTDFDLKLPGLLHCAAERQCHRHLARDAGLNRRRLRSGQSKVDRIRFESGGTCRAATAASGQNGGFRVLMASKGWMPKPMLAGHQATTRSRKVVRVLDPAGCTVPNTCAAASLPKPDIGSSRFGCLSPTPAARHAAHAAQRPCKAQHGAAKHGGAQHGGADSSNLRLAHHSPVPGPPTLLEMSVPSIGSAEVISLITLSSTHVFWNEEWVVSTCVCLRADRKCESPISAGERLGCQAAPCHSQLSSAQSKPGHLQAAQH